MRAVVIQTEVPSSLFNELDTRDAAAWVLPGFVEAVGAGETAQILSLPWSFVLSESSDSGLIAALEESEPVDSPLVRRRGIVHVVSTNPADMTLPPRSLPIYLLAGTGTEKSTGLAALTRRLNMLEELKRRSIKHLVILSAGSFSIPGELTGLWDDGFRSFVSVFSNDPKAAEVIADWHSEAGGPPIALVTQDASRLAAQLHDEYLKGRDGRTIVRMRDAKGSIHRIDISELDDPEHPLLGRYEILTEQVLSPLMPDDLQAGDVEGFFKDTRSSWRPFAAGMAWRRSRTPYEKLKRALKRLDNEGAENNHIFYISSEAGAGATTLLRDLAWTAASEGYPVLLANPAPFSPAQVEVASYISRCLEAAARSGIGETTRLYQVPWIIAFDRTQWEGREGEIISFSRDLENSGRRVCILFVTGPYMSMSMLSDKRFEEVANLTHQVKLEEALDLGAHLNKFLKRHGTTRSEGEWRNFFSKSAINSSLGMSAFWIALSFWLQRQFDIGETIQSWLYRQYTEKVSDPIVKKAIIEIAAMSVEHQPLPEELLPISSDWPTAVKLADLQRELGALGIVRFTIDTKRYWALVHDLLGRFLLNAIYFDMSARIRVNLQGAKDPEHMRLLLLAKISESIELNRKDLRQVADAFPTAIFKIDPDHGRALFSTYWQEALSALDGMPKAYRGSSRTFLHHTAISRRRIAKDTEFFPMPDAIRVALLMRAITDLETALEISADYDDESDLNLLNSLAHVYHDLAEVQKREKAPAETIAELLSKARGITLRAYRLNPGSSFVIETYARDLLSAARSDPSLAAINAIEVLGIIYGSMGRNSTETRLFALGKLADAAFDILFEAASKDQSMVAENPVSAAILDALQALAGGVTRFEGMQLTDYPEQNRKDAASKLSNPVLRDNPQAIRLRYLLTCNDSPFDFALQLELLENLEGIGSFTPQMRLELAILMYQRDRHHEAEKRFRELRLLWRKEDHYVEIPQRLRWLRVRDKTERRQVHARVTSSGDGRYFAKIREMQDAEAVFRPQEFGQVQLRPKTELNGLITFGHNGPFLRPLTAT